MGDFTKGGEWVPKNGAIFVYGDSYISLDKSNDGLQPTCMYQLRVKHGPQEFCLGIALVKHD